MRAAIGAARARARSRTDVAGAALLAVVLSRLVLVASMVGTSLGWGEPPVLAALGGFLIAENRAEEPILPLRLNAVAVVNEAGLSVGMAVFGTITLLPLYAGGAGISPVLTELFLLPMMAGLIGALGSFGRVMGRTGRYKALPATSTALLALVACWTCLGLVPARRSGC